MQSRYIETLTHFTEQKVKIIKPKWNQMKGWKSAKHFGK